MFHMSLARPHEMSYRWLDIWFCSSRVMAGLGIESTLEVTWWLAPDETAKEMGIRMMKKSKARIITNHSRISKILSKDN